MGAAQKQSLKKRTPNKLYTVSYFAHKKHPLQRWVFIITKILISYRLISCLACHRTVGGLKVGTTTGFVLLGTKEASTTTRTVT